MTLLPVEEVRIGGWGEWLEQRYPVETPGLMCCVPGCSRQADHIHHIVRRSFTGNKPTKLIIIDQLVVDNRAPMCEWHHWPVTSPVGGHGARISWDPERGWLWHERVKVYGEDRTFIRATWSAGVPLNTKGSYGEVS